MDTETELREQLATCSRILAMQQLLGLFGHVSVFDPKGQRVYMSPSMGFDKAEITPDDIVVGNLEGRTFIEKQRFAIEWPIHMALHGSRDSAIAVAHLHSPYATLFSVSEKTFAPITLEGTIFSGGLPIYDEPQLVTTMDKGKALARAMGDRPAIFMRGHGIAVAGRNIEQMLYSALLLEDEACKHVRASTLGAYKCWDEHAAKAYNEGVEFSSRAHRCWHYYCQLESRWNRQPGTGCVSFV
jgi:ribulose-5-phosphate 4-epimerase/fuculose-1-phosphate aldolase